MNIKFATSRLPVVRDILDISGLGLMEQELNAR